MPKNKPLDIEAIFTQLSATIEKLENENADLKDSLDAFEQGVGLIKQAQAELQNASQRVNVLLEDSEEDQSMPLKEETTE